VSSVYVQIIRNIRLRLGEPPRNFGRKEMGYLRIKPPAWCKPAVDELHAVYRDLELLLTHGTAVWGALVQANDLLFAPGPQDSPGVAIYTPEPHWHDDLMRLSEMAKTVFALKTGGGKTEQEREIGAWLADERKRFMSHPLPASIARESPVVASAVMFSRKHLPGGVLSCGFFPLLVHAKTKAALIVPARYWDAELVNIWTRPD
jgi:hypothetical protein